MLPDLYRLLQFSKSRRGQIPHSEGEGETEAFRRDITTTITGVQYLIDITTTIIGVRYLRDITTTLTGVQCLLLPQNIIVMAAAPWLHLETDQEVVPDCRAQEMEDSRDRKSVLDGETGLLRFPGAGLHLQ